MAASVALSRTITAALDYAATLAAKLDAQVHVLHVVTLPDYGFDLTGAASATMISELSEQGEQELAKLLAARKTTAFGPPLLRIGDARTAPCCVLAVRAS